MTLLAGDKLGPYEILNPLGAGGMGEVYKARDSRLNRLVAIKVLPAERVADAERKRRFIQEAQAASALNHPNIITIHDIASDNGRDYLVMEYVAGKTLDALIPRSGMRLGELLKIAIQITDGLSKAHGAGIIHRDLKPSNIMVSDDGLVKVLDFGLAKLTEPGPVSEDEATRTIRPKTEDGTVMGTAAYMSPEQAEGKPLDARSDIFSFGAVLYEAATGQRAFRGDSQAAILAAVLNKDPKPLSEEAPGVPKEFERVILRCLRKEPGKRQQHMTDVKVLLEELKEESESGKLAQPGAAAASSRRRWPFVAAVAALAIMVIGGVWLSRSGEKQPPPRLVPLTTFAGSEDGPSFSPDGSQVAFAWNGEKEDNWDIYVKMIGSATALRLTTDAAVDRDPAWSPDGRQIAFVKYGEQIRVYLISPLGGPEQKILDFDADSAPPSWSPDGKFLVIAKRYRQEALDPGAGTLFLVPAQGGEPRPILVPKPGRRYQHPAFAPGGRALAFKSCPGAMVAPYCDILIVDLTADWLPQGQPRQAATAVGRPGALAWTADGRSLIYCAGNDVRSNPLWRVDVARGGEPQLLEMATRSASTPAVALRGNRLAFSQSMNDTDIWRLEPGGKPQPLLVSSMADMSPQLSSDGRRIAFASSRGVEGIAIWLANADGSGLVQLTRGPETYQGSPRWSPDGRSIAFDAQSKAGLWNIKVVDSSGGQPRQLTDGPFSSTVPSWSHDGRWIYFGSDRGGRFEIWRVSTQGGPATQITRAGGYVAIESADAQTLYYIKSSVNGPLYSRPLAGGEEKQVLDYVSARGLVVFEDGIYYLVQIGQRNSEIRFHEFATGRSRVISSFEGRLGLGLSVSPDRKTFLFTWQVSSGSDLMLIENFR